MALLLAVLLSQEFRTNLPEHDVRVKVLGFASAAVERPPGDPERVPGTLDCVIVGGGLSGLAAAFYLQDLQTVVLERDERAGGLACRGATEDGVAYARGSTSFAEPPDLVLPLYRELGLTPLEDTLIPAPVDGWWRNGALLDLPPDFKAFHAKLLRGGRIPVQPLERAEDLTLDRISAAEYIREFGPELKACLDAFCRSSLGGPTDDVSALAFANAYAAQIGPRHAWPGGAGVHLAEKLKSLLRLGATAVHVAQDADGVDVDYLRGGTLFRVRARQAILAVPLRTAEGIFPGLPEERRTLIRSLKVADTVVHQIFTSKDFWTKSYGAWFTGKPFTRLIASRWIETKGFRTPPAAGPGILTIHQTLSPRRASQAMDARAVNDLAIEALQGLYDVVPELRGEKALAVESTRWPASFQICPPGFFSDVAPRLTPPVGRVRFAGVTLGVPSFEEALYRGHRAALDVREALRTSAAPGK